VIASSSLAAKDRRLAGKSKAPVATSEINPPGQPVRIPADCERLPVSDGGQSRALLPGTKESKMKKLVLIVAAVLSVSGAARAQGLDGVFSNLPDDIFDDANTADVSSMSDGDFAKALEQEMREAAPGDLSWIDDLNRDAGTVGALVGHRKD
jgi:hypothetical protein